MDGGGQTKHRSTHTENCAAVVFAVYFIEIHEIDSFNNKIRHLYDSQHVDDVWHSVEICIRSLKATSYS